MWGLIHICGEEFQILLVLVLIVAHIESLPVVFIPWLHSSLFVLATIMTDKVRALKQVWSEIILWNSQYKLYLCVWVCLWVCTMSSCLCVCKGFALNEVWPFQEDMPALKWQVVYRSAFHTPIASSNKWLLIMWKHSNRKHTQGTIFPEKCVRYGYGIVHSQQTNLSNLPVSQQDRVCEFSQ